MASFFESFSERARQVVLAAQAEARLVKGDSIGTEHILLGLLREEGVAARVLESLDITEGAVRAQVVQISGPGMDSKGFGGNPLPFTPSAKQALRMSRREGLDLGHNFVDTSHILLGLLRVEEGTAMRVLLDLETDAEKIRGKVIDAYNFGA